MSERIRLGDLLVSTRVISTAQLDEALSRQRGSGLKIGEVLVALGHVSEIQVAQVLSHQLSLPWVNLHHVDFSRELLNLVPGSLAERGSLVPVYLRKVRRDGQTLFVATDDPLHTAIFEELSAEVGLPVKVMVASGSEVRNAIRVYYRREVPTRRLAGPKTDEVVPVRGGSWDDATDTGLAAESSREYELGADGDGMDDDGIESEPTGQHDLPTGERSLPTEPTGERPIPLEPTRFGLSAPRAAPFGSRIVRESSDPNGLPVEGTRFGTPGVSDASTEPLRSEETDQHRLPDEDSSTQELEPNTSELEAPDDDGRPLTLPPEADEPLSASPVEAPARRPPSRAAVEGEKVEARAVPTGAFARNPASASSVALDVSAIRAGRSGDQAKTDPSALATRPRRLSNTLLDDDPPKPTPPAAKGASKPPPRDAAQPSDGEPNEAGSKSRDDAGKSRPAGKLGESKSSKPSDSDGKLSDGKLSDGKPSTRDGKPSDSTSKPSSSTSKPSDNDSKPSDSDSKPSSRDGKPSDLAASAERGASSSAEDSPAAAAKASEGIEKRSFARPNPQASTAKGSASRSRAKSDGVRAERSRDAGKRDATPKMLRLTLLDGTEVALPTRRSSSSPEELSVETDLTSRDLVRALLLRGQGGDVGEVLPEDRWETLFAVLLSVLLRKGLVADWEFIEEWSKHRSPPDKG